jgi:hypothetical protein
VLKKSRAPRHLFVRPRFRRGLKKQIPIAANNEAGLAQMNLKVVYEGGAFAFLKSDEMARPMPAAGKAWKLAANDELFRKD